MKINFLSILVIIVIFFSGCDDKKTTNSHENVDNNSKEVVENETITLKGLNKQLLNITIKDSKTLHIKEYKNRVILLNFFTSWCPPCKAEIPHLINLQNRYKDDFKIISISLDKKKTKEQMKEFVSKYGINYFVNFGESSFLIEKKIGGVQTVPMMLMYDKNGDYFTHYSSAVPEEMIEADIKKAMEK